MPMEVRSVDMSDPGKMDEPAIRESLQRNVDMSEYESFVYLSLVRNGKQSMKEIAETSGVPKQRVYDIVDTLRSEGFIELDDSYPKKAYAVEPNKTLGPIQTQIRRVQDRLDELHKTVSDIESGVAQFKNISTIEKYVSELFAAAENTVFLLASPDRLRQFEDDLLAMGDVQVRVVVSDVNPETLDAGSIFRSDQIEQVTNHIRGTSRSEPFVLTIDRNSGFFWPKPLVSGSGEQEGFYVTDSELAFLFDRFLSDSIWPLATSVTSEADESTPSLPTQYFRLRDCLADLQMLAKDVPLESLAVTFDGYDNLSGDQVTKTGVLAGFTYSEYDDVAYVELDVGVGDGSDTKRVTVGDWKSEGEDFKAHQISLEERDDRTIEALREETAASFQACLEELPTHLSPANVVVGFDGYTDHIRTLVGERKSQRMYEEIGEFDTVREMFTRAALSDRTLQFEWAESERVPGGHTAHAGRTMEAIGYDVQLIGYFGQPVREEFSETFTDATLLSLGQPTSTEYLQFGDGKVLFTDSRTHRALNWETLCEYVPLDDMVDYLEGTDVVSIGGWALFPQISTIWEGFREQVYPQLSNPPKEFLIPISSVAHLRETTLRSDIDSLSALNDVADVTVVATRDDAEHLGAVFLDETDTRRQRALPTMATELRRTLDVSRVAITTTRESVLAAGGDPHKILLPRTAQPAEEGTVEDHFTAGFAIGLTEGLTEKSSLALATALSGYYKQHQSVPDVEELRSYLSAHDDLSAL